MKKGTSWKTTLFGGIGAILTACSQIPQFAAYSGVLIAAGALFGGLALACAKDGNVTGGDVSNGLKMLLLVFAFTFNTGKAGAQTYADGWSNVWVVAPDVANGILVSHNGTISANPNYRASDSLFLAGTADNNNGTKSDTSAIISFIHPTQGNIAEVYHKDSTGVYFVAVLHGQAILGARLANDSVVGIRVTEDGNVQIKKAGQNNYPISSSFSGSYTSDTANAIKYVVNAVPVINYTVTDSIIEVYGYISGVSSDSLLENTVDLTLPTGFTTTINGLNGIASVYSPAQTVKGNGVCLSNGGTGIRLYFYSSRKARADIYFRFSYRYI